MLRCMVGPVAWWAPLRGGPRWDMRNGSVQHKLTGGCCCPVQGAAPPISFCCVVCCAVVRTALQGDFVDRGYNSLEVFTILMLLKAR